MIYALETTEDNVTVTVFLTDRDAHIEFKKRGPYETQTLTITCPFEPKIVDQLSVFGIQEKSR